MNIFDISVTTTSKDYEDNLPIWDLVDDCVAGSKAVKAKGVKYLPMPNPTLQSEENLLRYEQYKFRALFMNVVGRTLSAMVGVVFSKPPKIEFKDDLNYLLENADGNGLGISQLSRGRVEAVTKKGRDGVLVDYPATDAPLTKADKNTGTVRPYMIPYRAQDIIQVRKKKIGAVNKTWLIVLKECIENGELYKTESDTQYRVLWLDDNGYYNVAVVGIGVDEKTNKKVATDKGQFLPRDAKGKPFTEIPFQFFGSRDNDSDIDEAPLYDLSVVNLSHYQNSADNEESSFICGQPSLFVYTENDAETLARCNNKKGIQIGARSANVLSQGDKAEFLQAEPNNLPKANMEQKEEMMVQLGARLVSPSKQQTAEAARINYGAETSQLSTIVGNVNQGFKQLIKWCSLYETGNPEPDFEFELNSNFFHETMSAQDITAWLAAVQQNRVTNEDFLNKMKSGGQIAEDREVQDILDELGKTEPTL